MKKLHVSLGLVVAGLATLAVQMSCATTTAQGAEGRSASHKTSAKSDPPAHVSHAAASLAPIPASEAVSAHNPYTDGACDFCHKGTAKDPGPLLKPVNELCFECHTDFQEMLAQRAVTHPPAADQCTNCHNPHNSRNKNLLLSEQVALCTGCHTDIKTTLETATVKHGALTQGGKCTNCHNPHASSVEKLLVQQPYDLCIQCHGKDGLTDPAGTKLTNMKTLLETNPVHHAPVANKDCTACHTPHGGPNFRLLVMPYPAKFYSPYDPEAYALCFTCHDSEKVTVPETTTATNFRDGSRNLHYVHVNKVERGRTCRACHEVHASKQPFQIRDGVPYGTQGWILKLNYQKTANGGTCDKTCHALRSYDRRGSGAGK